MRCVLVAISILLLSCADPTGAQTRPLTQADLESMTAEQIEAARIEAVWPVQSSKPIGELYREIRLALATLYYPVDMRTPNAELDQNERGSLQAFQRRIGSTNANGQLTVAEFAKLGRYARLEGMQRLTAGFSAPASENGTWAWAEGSWTMDDIAFPLNLARIRCDRQEETCEMTTVDVAAPDFRPRAMETGDYMVFLDTVHFYVDRWSDGIIEARSGSVLRPCRETRLVINTRTNRVFQSTQDLDPQGCEVGGRRLPPLLTPRIATLSDSFEASESYFNEIERQLRAVYGPLAPSPEE